MIQLLGLMHWFSIFVDNTRLEAPDGVLLTMCDRKKAQWYAYKGLGRIIEDSEDAFIVRLNFEPAGSLVFLSY